MAFLIDTVFDSGLTYLDTNGIRLDICYGTEPATYAAATSTATCGNDTVNCGAPAAGTPSGRGVTIPAITAGTVTDTQTAAWWALSDNSSILLATGPLSANQLVTNGNTFTLDAITITIIDAVDVP